jgi:hypothetical protein
MNLRAFISGLGGVVFLLILSVAAFGQINVSNSPLIPSVSPRVVTDNQGKVHSVWVEKTNYLPGTNYLSGDVYYAKADWATQQISTPVNLSNSGTVYSDTDEMASIAADGSGRIYVVWTEGWDPTCLLKVRIFSNGSWGAAYTVQTGLRFRTPRIAVTAEGDIYLVWWDFQWKIQSTARVNGAWEAVRQIISSSEMAKMADIDVGTNIVGVAFIKKASSYDVYQASYIQRGKGFNAAWSDISLVAPDSIDQVFTAVRIDSKDVAHIAWMDDAGNRTVQYSYKTSTGFSAPLALTGWSLFHSLFLSKRGDDIYFVWQLGGYGNGIAVQYDVRYANGNWRGVQQVPNSAGVTYGDIAASPDKSILYFVWDTNFYGNGDIYGWAEKIADSSKKVDFNSDGKEDLLWRHYGTGQNAVWFLGGFTASGSATALMDSTLQGFGGSVGAREIKQNQAPKVYRDIADVGGFLGQPVESMYFDPQDALAFNAKQGSGDGYLIQAQMAASGGPQYASPAIGPRKQALNVLSYSFLATVTDIHWTIVGTGDFNADRQTDILWRNYATGQNAVWFMNGTTNTGYTYLPTVSDSNWQIVGTGDFDGDGKTDILWRNYATGQNAVWFMAGATPISSAFLLGISDLNWEIAGTGDFNGDGQTDILWRNYSTGQNAVWYMNGSTYASSDPLPTVTDTNWRIVGTGDFNGDGKVDIIWRHSLTGQNSVWYMNGTMNTGYDYLLPVADSLWRIANR